MNFESNRTNDEIATETSRPPKNMSVTMVDPLNGSSIALNFVSMRLHPFDIISEQPALYADDDLDAVVTAHLFQSFRQGTQPSFSTLRSNTTNIEATDLFDPEILSCNHDVVISQDQETAVKIKDTTTQI